MVSGFRPLNVRSFGRSFWAPTHFCRAVESDVQGHASHDRREGGPITLDLTKWDFNKAD